MTEPTASDHAGIQGNALTNAAAPAGGWQTMAVRFTGSGSEYFRIWIVNLLLILLTLTLYLPFARARRMAYFQNNTLIGGDPLGFHADPWKMFRGYLLVLVLGILYWAVNRFVPTLAWAALLVFAALWPMLWRASLQFRLRNTSWRGVRLNFLGDMKGAYASMLPLFVPALAFAVLLPDLEDETATAVDGRFAGTVFGVVMLLSVVLLPWALARIKQYQHGGYAFAQERTRLSAGSGAFYRLYAKVAGVTLLVMTVMSMLIGTLFALFAGLGPDTLVQMLNGQVAPAMFVALGVLLVAMYAVLPVVVGAYMGSRFQNLLWSNTVSERLRFASVLRFGPLLGVTVLNWLLILLTLGLYWPFAKVRTARLKLDALSVEVQGDLNQWVAEAQAPAKGVLGDAAGDFFGIDMGL